MKRQPPRPGTTGHSPLVTRRRALTVLALGAAAPGVLAACSARDAQQTHQTNPASAPPPPASVAYQPPQASHGITPVTPVSVDVKDGWIQHVTLTGEDGNTVPGLLDADRTSFTTTDPLAYGLRYTWTGSAVGRDGKAVPLAGHFSTVDPQTTVNGQFQLADHQVVGVAAPVILQFDAAIGDDAKPDVERALTVTTVPPVEGSWAWLPDEVGGSRVHWRTRDYYPAGTKVHVAANLFGVPFGNHAFGARNSTLDIEIGRRQVVKADVASHRIQVITDAGVVLDLPASYGEADLPRNITRSGIHVVTEKYEDFYMSNSAAGYFDAHERFAVRISNNGEFIHANPSSAGAQGNSNVTNGCINLSTDNAQQYFATAIYGDPVEVTGTSIQLSYADGDIWDWAVNWDDWTAMSALAAPNSPGSTPNSPVPPTPGG
ncbi:MAG: L,D-transpeptidase [Mycobacterium sp.]|nr:MAG: L,D-transpeptidase [Mycobacterium sp.]